MSAESLKNITKEEQLALILSLTTELPSLRAKAGISQGDLAQLIGISRQTYSSAESGKRPLSWNTYLSLILFFDNCVATHKMLHSMNLFPRNFFLGINHGEEDVTRGNDIIAGIPESVTERLDAQAMHTIRTVAMMEYARCANLSSEEAVHAFSGTVLRYTPSETDAQTQKAINSIKRRFANA